MSWKWAVSGLLLLATMINYMDRQTLAAVSDRVKTAFALTNEQYGTLELGFGLAFAAGAVAFGVLADRVNVWLLYPAVVAGWSAAGVLTGLVSSFEELLACRTLLGFCEAGHWPCALVVTKRLLSAADRTLGNSILQSGASVGGIVTPPLILALVSTSTDPGVWRTPFVVVGLAGLSWLAGWFALVRPGDLRADTEVSAGGGFAAVLADRRFYALGFTIVCMNVTWQTVRAWLPLFLQQGRGYTEAEALWFNSAYFIATDVGCLLAGAAVLALARTVPLGTARLAVFAACAVATGLSVTIPYLPAGWVLLAVLLLIGAGSLGQHPLYYSLTQEVGGASTGKAIGLLAAGAWVVSAGLQPRVGKLVDVTGSYDVPFALIGTPPLVAAAVLWLVWPRREA